jgi:uncharacterized RDD family membrane protein YckC
MRCPKCHYIGFESGERCRNCGYDFSLAVDAVVTPDLAVRKEPDPAPLADFTLSDPRDSPGGTTRSGVRGPSFDLDRIRLTPPPANRELPLFEPPGADDKPLVNAPAVPRAPLAVRRATPEIARLRARLRHDDREQTVAEEGRQETGDRKKEVENRRQEIEDRRQQTEDGEQKTAVRAQQTADRTQKTDTVQKTADKQAAKLPLPRIVTIEQALQTPEAAARSASLGERYGAAICDLLVIGSVDAAVVYLTLKMSGLAFAEISVIPALPLLAFLLLLNGGYLFVMTAAGGQTVGKMATRTKVVDATGGPLPLGRAALRAFGSIVSALPAGLGFVAAAVDADRLTLHDRLARTRVITVAPHRSAGD